MSPSIWNNEEPQPVAVPLLGLSGRCNAAQDDYDFIGRDGLIGELLAVLDETQETRGCYLIAGFRGSGKTCLINKVLSLHAARAAPYPGWLSFSQYDGKTAVKRKRLVSPT